MDFPIWSADTRDTITAVLARSVTRFPQNIFLDFQGDKYTVAELDKRSNQLAHGLAALGVAQGDRVGSLLDSNIHSLSLWFALNKLGAIHVPVNTAYKGEFLRHQFANAGCKLLVAEADYSLRIADIADQLPDCEHLLVNSDGALPEAGKINVHRLADSYVQDDRRFPDINKPEDLCLLIYTGGTTGPSKACMISHNYACNLARQILKREERTAADVNWTPLPLFHMNALAGSILSCLMVGATVAIFPRFSVSQFWDDIERSGATVANLLGAMIGFVADAPDTEASKRYFGKLKAVRGSPFPPDLEEKWKSRFGVTYTGSHAYGLTEAARVTTLPDGVAYPPGSSGKVNEDFDVRIVDDDDNEVPPNTAGEIIIRPRHPNIMFEGYWNQPAETLRIMKNLWLHTGDIGKFDEDGYFYFVDRKKDYLRRRGENISSFEMEKTIKAHPEINEVAVHAVITSSEDEVKATVVRLNGSKLTEEELCRWCVDQMPYFAVPRFIEFRRDLPKNPVGRVLKYQLRDEGCTKATWDREKTDFELIKR